MGSEHAKPGVHIIRKDEQPSRKLLAPTGILSGNSTSYLAQQHDAADGTWTHMEHGNCIRYPTWAGLGTILEQISSCTSGEHKHDTKPLTDPYLAITAEGVQSKAEQKEGQINTKIGPHLSRCALNFHFHTRCPF